MFKEFDPLGGLGVFSSVSLFFSRAPRCGSGPNCPLEGPPPPQPPIVTAEPFPQATAPPLLTLPPSFFPQPPPPLALFAVLREGVALAGAGEGSLGRRGVEGGGLSKRHLCPNPHLGALDFLFKEKGQKCAVKGLDSEEPISGNPLP